MKNQLPNTSLKRNNGKITVLIYRMPTYTDQYLHYNSHYPASCKENVAIVVFVVVVLFIITIIIVIIIAFTFNS